MSDHMNFKYIRGLPGLMKKMGGTITITESELIFTRFLKEKAKIKLESILRVETKKETELIQAVEKDKSVIGRGIVGGLLLGPLGAIVGGISGVGKKTKEPSKTQVHWYVQITYELDGLQNTAIFQIEAPFFKERTINKLLNDIHTNRQLAISKTRLKTYTEEKQSERVKNNTLSVSVKLKDLKGLFESDLITDEEYTSKKHDLLSKF